MAEYFDFEVGEREVHRVQYYDEHGGYLHLLMLDGEMISGERSIFSDEHIVSGVANLIITKKLPNLKKGNEMNFQVGEEEVHDVKIIFRTAGPLGKIIGARIEVDGETIKDIEKEAVLENLVL